ncbi:MAG TPA: glycosyltransferase family 2 protein [Opitutaceae bacterium]
MPLELSILMPCLNEARTLAPCITKARAFLAREGIAGEVIVADNGSTDGSAEFAERLGARVVRVPSRGYGAALAGGIEAADGQFIIMADCDDSYDLSALRPFVDKLRAGYDLVVGNRFLGGIAPGAMPPMHRYLGNPLLSAIGRLFFHCDRCGDFYCGIRGFRKEAIQRLDLQCRGMEFALEMIVKATLNRLRITEVPATLSPDGRDRLPHLRRYRDGWRSLRFYLLMSPRWVFAVPGAVLMAIGLLVSAVLLTGPVTVMSVTFDYHTLMYSAALISIGYQSILLAAFAKLMAIETGLHPAKTRLGFLQQSGTLERLLIAGGIMASVGLALGVVATNNWHAAHFGALTPSTTIRFVIGSVLFLLLGSQTMLAGFYLGIINILVERRVRSGKTGPGTAQRSPAGALDSPVKGHAAPMASAPGGPH